MRGGCVGEFLVGGDQGCMASDGQGDVDAVVDGAVVFSSNNEGHFDQSCGRDRRQGSSLHQCQRLLGGERCASALSNRLPKRASKLGPKQVWNDKLDAAALIAVQ